MPLNLTSENVLDYLIYLYPVDIDLLYFNKIWFCGPYRSRDTLLLPSTTPNGCSGEVSGELHKRTSDHHFDRLPCCTERPSLFDALSELHVGTPRFNQSRAG